ncbi:MAG TPA: addiction module protein [Candidatus Defluviicoccus seviourii]|nr:addiction module protein [Candidatus Defluviicoccus seviourii]
MAETDLSRLRAAALALPEAGRAALAHALVMSLDAPADIGVAQAWDEELLRRLNEIDSGAAKLIDRDQLRRRMQAQVGTP